MKTLMTILITTTLVLTACSGGTDSQKTLAKPEVKIEQPIRTDGIEFKVARAVTLEEDLSNLEEFERSLNIYYIQIKIPKDLTGQLQIKKFSENARSYQYVNTSGVQYDGNQAVLVDAINLQDAKLATQKFEYQISSNGKLLQPINFSIKPDLVIIGTVDLASLPLTSLDLDIGTLFIDTDSRLVTGGESISITATNILSNNGRIETLSEEYAGTSAIRGHTGKNGGDIVVKTNLLAGNLKFIMRGQKGGQGMDGIPVTEVPPQAAPGRDSADHAACDWSGLLVSPPVQALIERPPHEHCSQYCPQYARNGEPGAKGLPGNKGNSGAQGGSTGTLNFSATKATRDQISVELIPGAGGEAGAGGPGGAGGAGGNPGAIRTEVCRSNVSAGPQGPAGDAGETGAPGFAGESLKPVLTINGKTE
ncbi:MAG: collagen-like protein [Bdellovibrionales bacterium]|nr:collagen-like protein [Bdellovibrionales bacterium]